MIYRNESFFLVLFFSRKQCLSTVLQFKRMRDFKWWLKRFSLLNKTTTLVCLSLKSQSSSFEYSFIDMFWIYIYVNKLIGIFFRSFFFWVCWVCASLFVCVCVYVRLCLWTLSRALMNVFLFICCCAVLWACAYACAAQQ